MRRLPLQIVETASRWPIRVHLAIALAGFATCTPGFAQTAQPLQPRSDTQTGTIVPSQPNGTGSDDAKGGDRAAGAAAGPATEAGRQPTKSAADARSDDHAAFFSAHLAALHAGLALTSEQESLWPPVDAAIRALDRTTNRRRTRQEIASLLDQSPSDLLRTRGEQLGRRGDAMRQLAEAAAPLVEKLDDAQKTRLPLLLDGMRPQRILRAAFDIRWGRVVDDPDDESSQSGGRGEGGRASSDERDRGGGQDRRSSAMQNDTDTAGNRGQRPEAGDRWQQDARQPRHRFDTDDDDRM